MFDIVTKILRFKKFLDGTGDVTPVTPRIDSLQVGND